MTDSTGIPTPPEPQANGAVPPAVPPVTPPPAPEAPAAPAAPAYTAPEAAPAAPTAYAPAAAPAVPGKTLGIVALIVAIFFNLIGLILGIVALNQSKKAGAKNGPAVAAIIVGAVLMVLGIIIFAAFGALIFNGVSSAVSELCAGLDPGVYDLTDGTQVTCP